MLITSPPLGDRKVMRIWCVSVMSIPSVPFVGSKRQALLFLLMSLLFILQQ